MLNSTEGTTQLATTLTDISIQNISAIVTLTNAEKFVKYYNDVRTDLDLRTILPTALPPLQQDLLESQIEDTDEEKQVESDLTNDELNSPWT